MVMPMAQNIQKERRKEKRFLADEGLMVVSANTFAQVMNISKGGLAFRYLVDKNEPILSSLEVGLLYGDNGLYIDKIACRLVNVTDSSPIHGNSSTIIRKTCVQFHNLTSEQTNDLQKILTGNITSEIKSSLTH